MVSDMDVCGVDRQVIEQKLESLRCCLSRLRLRCPASADKLAARLGDFDQFAGAVYHSI